MCCWWNFTTRIQLFIDHIPTTYSLDPTNTRNTPLEDPCGRPILHVQLLVGPSIRPENERRRTKDKGLVKHS